MSDPQQGIFGIDLGTTYSVVGYIDETGRATVTRNRDGEDTTPSVVFFENADNVVVGKVAKESAGQYPDQVVSLIKREMGDRDYQTTFFGKEHTPPSISALILSALAQDAELHTGRSVTDVVITVPAYFGLLEKDATRQAGEIAGLNVIGIVPEPVAAALHYGVTGDADGSTFLVYDLGGGTFDISLIKLTDASVEVLTVGGDHRLGGVDWDEKLFDHIVEETIAQCGDETIRDDEAMLQDLRTLAEKTKRDLSRAESKKLIVRSSGTAANFTVTRQQFEEMTAELLEETVRITERTLEEAERHYPGVRGQIRQLLLVGGSSRMPAVSEILRREFGWEPRLTDPDLAVAKGAALYAAGQTVRFVDHTDADAEPAETGETGALPAVPLPATDTAIKTFADQSGLDEDQVRALARRTVVNVLPKAVGVKLVDTSRPDWETDPEAASVIEHLVPAQTQLPYTAPPFVSGTLVANQSNILLEVWEQAGASPSPEVSDNHRVDEGGVIEGLEPFALPAGSPINIEMNVDAEGTVHLVGTEPTSGRRVKIEARISILSEEQVAEAKYHHSGLTVST